MIAVYAVLALAWGAGIWYVNLQPCRVPAPSCPPRR